MTTSDDAKARLAKVKSDKNKRYVTDPAKAVAREQIATARSAKFRYADEPVSSEDMRRRYAEADRILSSGYANIPMGLICHPDLNGRDVQTAAVLLHYARSRPTTYVSEDTMAERMGCKLTAVRDSLKRLADANLIRIDPRGHDGRSNLYYIEGLREPSISGQDW